MPEMCAPPCGRPVMAGARWVGAGAVRGGGGKEVRKDLKELSSSGKRVAGEQVVVKIGSRRMSRY